MTDINHRRKNRPPVNKRYPAYKPGTDRFFYKNGYPPEPDIDGKRVPLGRIGRTDFLDKSLHGWGRISTLADVHVGASIGNDFTDGHRGMAHQVKGAKKFVRSRIRFHENAATKKLAEEESDG